MCFDNKLVPSIYNPRGKSRSFDWIALYLVSESGLVVDQEHFSLDEIRMARIAQFQGKLGKLLTLWDEVHKSTIQQTVTIKVRHQFLYTQMR